jgi:predicted protein tyrosine phosphatase
MTAILVTSLPAMEGAIRAFRPSHLVTLLSPEHMIETPPGFPSERHLQLALNDVAETWASEAPPTERHIERLLSFGRAWLTDAPMLVHCWAGISRSTAAAYILLCDRAKPGTESMIAHDLRARAPHACPNVLMIRLADEMLERRGRMVEAIARIGRGEIAAESGCVELPVPARDA